MEPLRPRLPKLSEEEISANQSKMWAEERAREEFKRKQEDEAERFRRERIRGIPALRYKGVEAKPWIGGLLHGPAGTGKTHEAIARLLSEPAGVFISAADFISIARDEELNRAEDMDSRRHTAAFSRPFLVLDDLGSRRPTEFAVDAVHSLVDHRWLQKMETIVTSNLSPAQLAEAWGDRIASRIFGFGKPEEITGRDHRV